MLYPLNSIVTKDNVQYRVLGYHESTAFNYGGWVYHRGQLAGWHGRVWIQLVVQNLLTHQCETWDRYDYRETNPEEGIISVGL